jgi:hypothetical protein
MPSVARSKKNATGSGTDARRRKDGRYEARVTLDTPNGRRRVNFYGKTAGTTSTDPTLCPNRPQQHPTPPDSCRRAIPEISGSGGAPSNTIGRLGIVWRPGV